MFLRALLLALSATLTSIAWAQQLSIGPVLLKIGDEQGSTIETLRQHYDISLAPLKPGPDAESFIISSKDGRTTLAQLSFYRQNLSTLSVRLATCPEPMKSNCVLDAFFDAVFRFAGETSGYQFGQAKLHEPTVYGVSGMRHLSQCLPSGAMVLAQWTSPGFSPVESFVSVSIAVAPHACSR